MKLSKKELARLAAFTDFFYEAETVMERHNFASFEELTRFDDPVLKSKLQALIKVNPDVSDLSLLKAFVDVCDSIHKAIPELTQ